MAANTLAPHKILSESTNAPVSSLETTTCITDSFDFCTFRIAHSAKVNIYGLPYIREMPKITGISGTDLMIKCPVAGYPIDKVQWERG